MFHVVGGVYRERCLEPEWDEWFGSGLRAAAAVTDILGNTDHSPLLHSWVSDKEREEITLKADTLSVAIDLHARQDAIEFQYEHGLSVPRVYPDPAQLVTPASEHISIENGIVFGLIEDAGRGHQGLSVKVSGKRVIYDPQAGLWSLPWSHTGHSSGVLAIVANLKEAEAMATALHISASSNNMPKPLSLATSLRDAEKAAVVVIKNGAEGAYVVTNDDQQHICSYKTSRVFPIGSGDVFTAIFGAYWGALGLDPVLAAQRASIGAALYCEAQMIPIPQHVLEEPSRLVAHTIPHTCAEGNRPTVYIAAPLFNFQQRWFISEIQSALADQGVRTFSPYHQVGISKDPQHIVKEDLKGLETSQVIFAVLDGLDSGTLFEIGYAAAKGIPVIGFKQCTHEDELTMLRGHSGCMIFDDFPTAVYHAAWKALEV